MCNIGPLILRAQVIGVDQLLSYSVFKLEAARQQAEYGKKE